MNTPDASDRAASPGLEPGVRRPPVRGRGRRLTIALFTILPLAILEAAVRIGDATWRQYDTRFQHNAYDEKQLGLARAGDPKIVLMGSSRTDRGLVPELFTEKTGLSAFNFGVGGAKVGEWQSLARRAFALRKPRLVVLGLNAAEFRSTYLPIDAAHHTMDLSELEESVRFEGPSIRVVREFAEEHFGRAWETLGRRNQIKLWLEERSAAVLPKHAQVARETRERVARPLPADGYLHPWQIGLRMRLRGAPLPVDPLPTSEACPAFFDPDGSTFARLETFLAWLHGRGIPVFAIYIPNSPLVESEWHRIEPLFFERLAGICRKQNVPFLDARKAAGPRTNGDYMDEIHVGYPLACRISRAAVDAIVADGLVTIDATLASAHEDAAEP